MSHDVISSVDQLFTQINAGWQPEYIFFWGHESTENSPNGKWCLSQWFAAPFVIDGITYPTAEHFMMAEKARLFGDEATLAQILAAPHPGVAKALGRQVRDFDEAVWAEQRFDIVVRGNLTKFSQNEALQSYLLTTNEKILVEASPTDTIWGIGLAEIDQRVHDPRQWRGSNLLGFALMQVRAELQEEEYLAYLEAERHMYKWCLIHIGGYPEHEAKHEALAFYEYESPEDEYRSLVFHDEAWH
ncbi:MAG TPA: NADAR family protein [Caldilineaceae bacterium]|nr:NADAR family protein [Caldilineaceae bacterium]